MTILYCGKNKAEINVNPLIMQLLQSPEFWFCFLSFKTYLLSIFATSVTVYVVSVTLEWKNQYAH